MTTDPAPAPVVHTCGGDLRGIPADGGGAVFAGIPFAAPPLGDRRFRPPLPLEPWTGVRDATVFRGGPAQRNLTPAVRASAPGTGDGSGTDGYRREKDVRTLDPRLAAMAAVSRHLDETSSEDCLYLNVWSPSLSKRHPVLVWIFGGGFESGTASPPAFDGAALSRLTGAVVVAANYRVGALGWLLPTGPGRERWADSANLGLQDQAATLRWVHDNIAGFGGDVDNVTLAGASAGAFIVGALLALPAAAGTFHKAILHSGSTGRIYPSDTAAAIADDLMAVVGAKDMDALAGVPLDHILDAQRTVIDREMGRRNLPGGRAWGLVLDGTVLTEHPLHAVAAGAATGIPLLVGANRDEFRGFAAIGGHTYQPPHSEQELLAEMASAGIREPTALLAVYRARLANTPTERAQDRSELGDLRTLFLTDAVYRIPAIRLARAQTEAGGTAHAYLFAGEPNGPRGGSHHGAEAMYLFDKLAAAGIDTPEHRTIRDSLTCAWADFIADGNPGWPTYNPFSTDNARQFGDARATVTEPPLDTSPFWNDGA
ncbi:carboxylesterase/lipase family protein [Parafrankia sp. FMc2]|uniref:carboxylesterase/lipase family protein n=1 Tax=Parafrankia sp. FMc2 TaxID=3233196 RepID=UPI0034D55A83